MRHENVTVRVRMQILVQIEDQISDCHHAHVQVHLVNVWTLGRVCDLVKDQIDSQLKQDIIKNKGGDEIMRS